MRIRTEPIGSPGAIHTLLLLLFFAEQVWQHVVCVEHAVFAAIECLMPHMSV